ncbi:hypothetical protein LSH36_119g03002 [Paralvinella palmiformis]|uniref:Uncharacterized protein n=1 Tax=Paralvinella palmiformis TaxID=53620 RepID=A0AAD9JXL6_9ANNE|nr:hypothetical protein LSH36_119g03002 [Paralvinella palmiformis]
MRLIKQPCEDVSIPIANLVNMSLQYSVMSHVMKLA